MKKGEVMYYVNLIRIGLFKFLHFKIKKFKTLEEAVAYADKMANHPNFILESITGENGDEIVL